MRADRINGIGQIVGIAGRSMRIRRLMNGFGELPYINDPFPR
jgi:hypothetical protein